MNANEGEPINEKQKARPKRRFMEGVKDDLKEVGVIEENAINRER